MEQMPAPSYAPKKMEYREPRKLPITAIAVVIVVAILAAGVYFLLQPAPKPSFSVKVTTSEGYPVSGASVELSGAQDYSGTTDNSGSASFEVQAGKYQLTVSAFGFDDPQPATVQVAKDDSRAIKLEGMRFTVPQQVLIAPLDSYPVKITVFNDKGDAVNVKIDSDSALRKYFAMPDAFPAIGRKDATITVGCADLKQADCALGLTTKKEGEKLTAEGKALSIRLQSGTSTKVTISVPIKLVFEKERRYQLPATVSLTLEEGKNGTVDMVISNAGSSVPLRNVNVNSSEVEVIGYALGGGSAVQAAASAGIHVDEVPANSQQTVRIFVKAGEISVQRETRALVIKVDIGQEHKEPKISLTVQKP